MVSEAWGRIYWTMVPVDTFTRVHSTLDDSPLSIQVMEVFGALLPAAVGQISVAVDFARNIGLQISFLLAIPPGEARERQR